MLFRRKAKRADADDAQAADTLLLIDDNELLLGCLADALRRGSRFRVLTATRAEAGLELLGQVDPVLVVLDLVMPGIGGVGFLRSIAGQDGKLRYPVLVLTVKAEMAAFCRELGVAGFLPKTCAWEPLLRAILSFAEQSAARRHAPREDRPRGWRMLLVEDDARLVETLRVMFNRVGFDVRAAATGADAMDLLAMTTPDLLLIKEVLPGMNGASVAAVLHGRPETRAIPVVLYDETRAGGDMQSVRRRAPENVKACIAGADPARLLEAACGVLRIARDVPTPGPPGP
jgi:DNA-binding response OmpR family regulator